MSLDIEWVRSELPGRRVDWYASLPSTMPKAARLATEGCASGTTVGADEQTRGQGRYGRTWHSEPDSGLYVSVVLRYAFSPETLPVVTLALGLAVTEAIQNTTNIACDLRWPNDVLIQDKKCAGILTQLEGPAVIAGIGINVNQTTFPPDIASAAISLRSAGNLSVRSRIHACVSREQLLVTLLPTIDAYCTLLAKQGKQPILQMFSHASSYVQGRRVTVEQGNATLTGTTAGLNESGFLLLQSDSAKQHVIIAGGVRPCS